MPSSQGRSFLLALRLCLTLHPRGWTNTPRGSLRRWINLIFACWLTHALIRQGLPSLYKRASDRPKPGLAGAEVFPTAQMPQPVRPTSRVHARQVFEASRLSQTIHHFTINTSLGAVAHTGRQAPPRRRPLSLPLRKHAVTAMNFRFSPASPRLALTVLGRGDGEGGREIPPVEPELSPALILHRRVPRRSPFSWRFGSVLLPSRGWTNRLR